MSTTRHNLHGRIKSSNITLYHKKEANHNETENQGLFSDQYFLCDFNTSDILVLGSQLLKRMSASDQKKHSVQCVSVWLHNTCNIYIILFISTKTENISFG